MHVRLPAVAAVLFVFSPAAPTQDKVSEFGRYEGWSEARFTAWSTASRYVAMRDGVKLAVDVTRPTVDGNPTDEKLPVVWTHSRYHRNPSQLVKMFNPNAPVPKIDSMVDTRPDLQRLVRHGYVVASVGVRGSGASFGRFEGLFSAAETKDAVEIIEWLADQPWCDGNVGMWGGSYLGITQYMAASQKPEALKAIFPDVAALDLYDLLYPGGIFRSDLIRHWDELTDGLDANWLAPVVDGDEDGKLLRAAVAEHRDNWQVYDNYRAAPFRDHATTDLTWTKHGPVGVLDGVREAKVPCYHFNGWFDVFVLDSVLWFANYDGPQRLTVGAWSHSGMKHPAYMVERMRLNGVEQHRWFDRFLKGIENGVDTEPPIRYAVNDAPGKWTWRSATTWPPADTMTTRRWFVAGRTGAIESVNDGWLSTSKPRGDTAFDDYAIDLETTTGTTSRWDNAVGAAPQMAYEGLADNDRRSLTYTSPPLANDVTVVGHPVVTLHVTATAGDADFFVVLEEVDADGGVHYVTEGAVRGSHRKLGTAPYENLGLPYQRSFKSDREPLPKDEPTAIVMDLHPTATRFDKGHRIRVAIFCADKDNTEQPAAGPPEKIRLFRDVTHASGITLPVLR